MKKITQSIKVGSLGVFDMMIPKIRFVSGNPGPKIVVTALQHGNEVTPLFVLRKLIRVLEREPLEKGELVILPVSNPLGLLFDTRREPLDGDDLNRVYPGSRVKGLGQRIGAILFDECSGASLAVDLHTFSRKCGFVGVLVKSGTEEERVCREALKVMQPDCVWQIDMTRKEDARFAGGIDLVLMENKTPALTLEMERHLTIHPEGIDRVANALLTLLESYGMRKRTIPHRVQEPIPVFVATYLYFDESGVFLPERDVLEEVGEGDRLGSLVDVQTFAQKPIHAATGGVLLTLRFRDFVRTGTKLGSVGTRAGVL